MEMIITLKVSAGEMGVIADSWRRSNYGSLDDLVVALLLNRRCVDAVKRLSLEDEQPAQAKS